MSDGSQTAVVGRRMDHGPQRQLSKYNVPRSDGILKRPKERGLSGRQQRTTGQRAKLMQVAKTIFDRGDTRFAVVTLILSSPMPCAHPSPPDYSEAGHNDEPGNEHVKKERKDTH